MNMKINIFIAYFLVLSCICPICIVKAESYRGLSNQEILSIYEDCWELLSRIHQDTSNLDKAIELYNQVLAAAPEDKDIYWKLSEMTFKKAEATQNEKERIEIYKNALKYAKTAKKNHPDSIEACFWLGCSSARLAEIINGISALPMINVAKKELVIAIKIQPEHRFAILADAILAAIYAGMPWPLQDLEKAEHHAREATRKDPNLTLASVTLAKIFKQQNRFSESRKEAIRCLNLKAPTYLWDAVLYNWPDARQILRSIEIKQ